jgi:hypothetical protein
MSALQITQIEFTICQATLITALTSLSLFHRIAQPFLEDLDHKHCLAYALEYLDGIVEDWKRVIWMDESSFPVGACQGSVNWILRTTPEEFYSNCINFKQREATGIMFGGCFRWGKMGAGVIFQVQNRTNIILTVYHNQILLNPL